MGCRVYLTEDACDPKSTVAKYFPVFRMSTVKKALLISPGIIEPDVERGDTGRHLSSALYSRVKIVVQEVRSVTLLVHLYWDVTNWP